MIKWGKYLQHIHQIKINLYDGIPMYLINLMKNKHHVLLFFFLTSKETGDLKTRNTYSL